MNRGGAFAVRGIGYNGMVMLKNKSFLLLLLMGMSVVLPSRKAFCTKAAAPVKLVWTVLQEPGPSRAASLRFSCTPAVDVNALQLKVKLPAKWKLLAGTLSWQGLVRAGKTISLDCSFEVPYGKFGRVVGTVKMPRGKRGRWVQALEQVFYAPRGYRSKVKPLRRSRSVLGGQIRARSGLSGRNK